MGSQTVSNALNTMSRSLENSFCKSHTCLRAERHLENLMASGRYLFIPFLRTKSQMGQTKNRSSKKSH